MADDVDPRFAHMVFTGRPVPVRRPRALPGAAGGLPRVGPTEIRRPSPVVDPDPPEPVSDDVRGFLATLFSAANVPLAPYRIGSLARRVPAAVRAVRARSLEAAAAIVLTDARRRELALDAILIGVTEFARDAAVFDELERDVLPGLLARDGGGDPGDGRRFRAWSVACSDGAELASVAILLAEAGALPDCELLGTDLRPSAVRAARGGWYPSESVRGLESRRRTMYFDPAGRGVRVKSPVRESLVFEIADAMGCEDAGAWDLILCRNLAIYLEPFAADDLWRRLCRALRPGGVLVVGKAEKPARPEMDRIGTCLYRKR